MSEGRFTSTRAPGDRSCTPLLRAPGAVFPNGSRRHRELLRNLLDDRLVSGQDERTDAPHPESDDDGVGLDREFGQGLEVDHISR